MIIDDGFAPRLVAIHTHTADTASLERVSAR